MQSRATSHNIGLKRIVFSMVFLTMAVGVVLIAKGLAVNLQAPAQSGMQACPKNVTAYTITIADDGFEPQTNYVTVCTKVLLVNRTNRTSLPAFGEHDHHDNLTGFSEKALAPGATNEFITKQQGTFNLHDHLDEELTGTLDITL